MRVRCFHVPAVLYVAVLTSLRVKAQECRGSVYSVSGSILVNHVFRVIMDSTQILCNKECNLEKRCQSHNFRFDRKICELNNRTKEARSDDLVFYQGGYYIERGDAVPLGSIPELPGNTCKEIKLSYPGSKTGRYWIDPENSNKPLHVVCDMAMEDVDECASGTHLCARIATCTNTKGSYECSCPAGYRNNGTNCTDVDECASGTHLCARIATCTNTKGSYECFYPAGCKNNGTNCTVPKNCGDVLKWGGNISGVYSVDPDGLGPFKVYCDQNTTGGGWTVFQKRQDGSVDFYRGWPDYKAGFGNLAGEFWLGLDKIYRLTYQTRNRLRVELEDTTGNSSYAEYDYFAVTSENDKYRLSLGTYSGNAGDSLIYHNGQRFSTKDQDNDDDNGDVSCAVRFKGAWWYKICHHSNLNGLYHNGAHFSGADGVNWKHWKGHKYSAKRAEMKIRPVGL